MSENVQADRADTGPAPSAPTPSITAASSLALRDIPIPDYCDVVIVPTRGVAETDPRVWARSEERRVGKECRRRGTPEGRQNRRRTSMKEKQSRAEHSGGTAS